MVYAWLCVVCWLLGLLGSFGPLCAYTRVYVRWEAALCMLECVGEVVHERKQGSAFWRTQLRPPKWRFGRRTPCGGSFGCLRLPPKEWTFGSVMHIRPPKVPPNMHEFRLWRGHSAAEPAAECVLSSLLLHELCDSFQRFRGDYGELFKSYSKYVWHLIRVHLCRIGPESSRRSSELEISESVQYLPEEQRWVELN